MRNEVYTIYKGYEVVLTRNQQLNYELIFRGKSCPLPGFTKVQEGVYVKQVTGNKEITNAYVVTTLARYKGYTFQVSNVENNIYQLTTADEQAYQQLKLEFIDRGYYEKWVPKSAIEKVWEERRKSGYGLPMPEGIKEIEEIEMDE